MHKSSVRAKSLLSIQSDATTEKSKGSIFASQSMTFELHILEFKTELNLKSCRSVLIFSQTIT